MKPSAAPTKVLGVVCLGSIRYGVAATALRRGVAVWGLDTRADARQRLALRGVYAQLAGIELAPSTGQGWR